MKLTLILLLFSLVSVTASTYSQNTRLDITFENGHITELFKEIQKKSEFYFFYQKEELKELNSVAVNAKDATVMEILDQVLAGKNLNYEIVDRYIVVRPVNDSFGKEILASIRETNDAQQRVVTGTVTDESGEPLPGVTVVVKGSTQGTITNADGEYTLADIPDDATLQFSFVGMRTQEVEVENQTNINVTMIVDAIGIEEVVAIGYGVQKKTTVTGAISTIQGEELAETPVPNISQSIAGKLAGVSMRPNGGQPGFDNPDIHIRGIVTTGDNAPLVVVDGVKRDNIRQIDPNIIESITILKDAAAVAPYGIGGANGVILITTKKGKQGKPTLRLSSSYSIQNPTYLPNMLSAKDYMALQNEGYYNMDPDGTTPPNDPDMVSNYEQLHAEDPYKYPSSNFVDLFNLNVPVHNHNLELSGGNELVNYHAGLGYYDQQGIFDPVSYNRYNYNISLESQVTNTTKASVSLHGSVENTNEVDPGENIRSGHMFRTFYKFIPTQSLIYPDGEHWGESSASTPVGALRSDGYNKIDRNTLLASISIEQELPFIEGLSVRGVFSYDPTQQNTKAWHLPFIYHKIDLDSDPYTFTEAVSLQEGNATPYKWLSLENNKWVNYTYQGYVNYSRTFNNHSFTGLLVAEARNSTSEWFDARRNNFAVDIDELSLGSSDKQDYDNGGSSGTASEIGYVYRFGYSFKDKYMLEAAGRYDGHYYFAPGERWGYFPSFSAAWVMSDENFMNNISQLDNLKLRASWGKSGMLAGSAFQYLAGYDLSGNAYAFGSGNLVQGSEVPREANPNITWEVSTKVDIGFDLIMWNGLLNFEFDYFHEDRTGMLLAPQVTLPVEYGLELSQENKGIMKNDGVEFTLGSRKTLSNGMELALNFNMSYAKNKMIEVYESDAQRNNPNRTLRGRPYGTPFGYQSPGLFSTDDDKNGDGIIDSEDGYNVEQFGELHPGDIRYDDLSGPEGEPDGKIDSHDLTAIGYPVYPALTYGFTPSVQWKGIDASIFLQGAAMASINTLQFMTVPFENNGSNTAYEYMDNRWTPDNQDAKYPRATPSPYANNTQGSDFWYVDTDFLRLKTAIIGYTLPRRITDKLQISGARIHLTGQNWLTFSKLKHVDPEMGYDNRETSYPLMKSTTLGVDITF